MAYFRLSNDRGSNRLRTSTRKIRRESHVCVRRPCAFPSFFLKDVYLVILGADDQRIARANGRRQPLNPPNLVLPDDGAVRRVKGIDPPFRRRRIAHAVGADRRGGEKLSTQPTRLPLLRTIGIEG
jgi:hypothetical protein